MVNLMPPFLRQATLFRRQESLVNIRFSEGTCYGLATECEVVKKLTF